MDSITLITTLISILVKDEIMVCHNRPGHPSFSYLKQLFPTLLKNIESFNISMRSLLVI